MQALLSCEALMHPRSSPRPAPLRPLAAQPAGGGPFGLGSAGATDSAGGEGAGVQLGRPAFWTHLDVVVEVGGTSSQQQPLQPPQQQQQSQQQAGNANGALVECDVIISEALPAQQASISATASQQAAARPAQPLLQRGC